MTPAKISIQPSLGAPPSFALLDAGNRQLGYVSEDRAWQLVHRNHLPIHREMKPDARRRRTQFFELIFDLLAP